MKSLLTLSTAILLAGCSELVTMHYVNEVDPSYGAAATGYRDTDGDGIRDFSDLCPHTEPGATVTDVGCPILLVELSASCGDSLEKVAVSCDTSRCGH